MKRYSEVIKRLSQGTVRKIILITFSFILIIAIFFSIQQSTITQSKTVKYGFEDIGELSTQAGYFTNVQKIEKAREVFGFQVPLTESKYIFSYSGTIKAGINFSEVKISCDEYTVYISIPEAKVLSCEIDPNSFVVYDETSNIFTPLKIDDVNTSFQLLIEEATSTAIANGLLENAFSNAQVLLKAFLEPVYSPTEYQYEFK